jgi:trimethylamine--corrinoid protein Co-methyltransferase
MMLAAGHAFDVLKADEIERIHAGALRVLAEMGMQVQNRELLEVCAQRGLEVDFEAQRVRFLQSKVEQFLDAAPRFNWDGMTPEVSASAGVYHGYFHDPQSNQLLPWTEENLAYYVALARSLPNIGSAGVLGCRFSVPAKLDALYERYFAWKCGAEEGGSILEDEVCPYLLELYQETASARGLTPAQVFRATVYLVPPFRLGVHEAYQVAYFRKHGLRVGIGDMYAMGATSPVTLAGSLMLYLAEQMALSMLKWAWFDDQRFGLSGSLSPMDMRTMIYPYGRPEMALANLALAQLARHYGVAYYGHAGLSDAKLPSTEAGAQKALTAIPTLLASGSFWMDAGLLSTDEVCSPMQLILDDEFLGSLKRFTQRFEVSEDTLGIETILAAGPGGTYIDKEHTARYFRNEHWQPGLWTRQMVNPWLDAGKKLDVDLARERALDFKRSFVPVSHLDEGLERSMLAIIERAKHALYPD